jgi:hypothetical protein
LHCCRVYHFIIVLAIKLNMRTLVLILCIGLFLAGCKKNNEGLPYSHQGTLTGYDARMCPSLACGGLEITVKNDTSQRPPLYYRINATLAQLGISESTKFPINVSLDYTPDTGIYAKYNYILVTKIKVVK